MLRLTWQTAEPDVLAARLARLGFTLMTGARGPNAALIGADVAIVARRAASAEGSLRLVDDTESGGFEARPEDGSAPAAVPSPDDRRGSGPRLVGLGWATVELERAAREFAAFVFEPAADDGALGARALLGHSAARGRSGDRRSADRRSADRRSGDRVAGETRGPLDRDLALVLLEPATEGRIAARLARHGEGPAVLYVAGPVSLDATAAAWRVAGILAGSRASGPLGPSVLALGTRSGPEVVAVEEGRPHSSWSNRRPAAGG